MVVAASGCPVAAEAVVSRDVACEAARVVARDQSSLIFRFVLGEALGDQLVFDPRQLVPAGARQLAESGQRVVGGWFMAGVHDGGPKKSRSQMSLAPVVADQSAASRSVSAVRAFASRSVGCARRACAAPRRRWARETARKAQASDALVP